MQTNSRQNCTRANASKLLTVARLKWQRCVLTCDQDVCSQTLLVLCSTLRVPQHSPLLAVLHAQSVPFADAQVVQEPCSEGQICRARQDRETSHAGRAQKESTGELKVQNYFLLSVPLISVFMRTQASHSSVREPSTKRFLQVTELVA